MKPLPAAVFSSLSGSVPPPSISNAMATMVTTSQGTSGTTQKGNAPGPSKPGSKNTGGPGNPGSSGNPGSPGGSGSPPNPPSHGGSKSGSSHGSQRGGPNPGQPGGSGGPGGPGGSGGPGSPGGLRRPSQSSSGQTLRLPFPDKYDGKEDIDVFDIWKFEVKKWAEFYRLDDKMLIGLMSKCMTGRVGLVYLRFVSEDTSQWMSEDVFNGIFNHCFPANYWMKLQEWLMGMMQGKWSVREFVCKIETLGCCFRDVNEWALINIFWNGVHKYIQTALLRRGLNPEHDELVRLIKYAIYEEEAEGRAVKNQSSSKN